MRKRIFVEGKIGTGAEQMAKCLAEMLTIPFYKDEAEQQAPCVVYLQDASTMTSCGVDTVKIYLHADREFREKFYSFESQVTIEEAARIIEKADADYRSAYVTAHGEEMGIAENYDLCMNTRISSLAKSPLIANEYIMARIMQDCFETIVD